MKRAPSKSFGAQAAHSRASPELYARARQIIKAVTPLRRVNLLDPWSCPLPASFQRSNARAEISALRRG